MDISVDPLVFSFFILVIAGFVKGGIGFGLPLVAVPFLTLVNSVELTLSMLAIPILATSIKLSFSGGKFVETASRFKLVLLFLFIGVLTGVYFFTGLQDRYIYLVLGSVLIVFTLLGKLPKKLNFRLSPNARYTSLLHSAVGFSTGLIGGMSSAYGPLVAAYFHSSKLEKDEFVTALNIVLMSGGFFMALLFGLFGIYTINSFFLSILACVPVFLGVFLGEKVRSIMNNNFFHRLVFFVLLLMGINLLRRGIMG